MGGKQISCAVKQSTVCKYLCTCIIMPVPQISINSPYSKSGKSYGWEYWDSAFYGRKRRKKRENHYGEKAEKKVEIFSIFSSVFSHYNREYWDSAFYGRKRRKKRIFSPYSFPLFLYQSRNQYGEKAENEYGEITDLHNILHKEYWNTGLQMAWSIITWIIQISRPEIVKHMIQWYGDAPTKI